MNLDKLISKYLDGELTLAEDKELRRRLSEDAVAKETFDAHVLIHAAFKEDAKTIEPSPELVSETEDKILTKFLVEQSFAGDTVAEKRSSRVLLYSSMIVLLLLAAAVSISDLTIGTGNNEIASVLKKDREKIVRTTGNVLYENDYYKPETIEMHSPVELRNDVVANVSNVVKDKNNTSIALLDNPSVATSKVKSSGQGNDFAGMLRSDLGASDFIFKDIDLSYITIDVNNDNHEILTPGSGNSNVTTNLLLDNGINSSINPSLNNFNIPDVTNTIGEKNENYFYGKRSEVQLTSFFGTEVFSSGYGSNAPKSVASFSQSIGYKINEKQHFGMDFGFMNYSIDETGIVSLPGLADNSRLHNSRQSSVEIRETGSSSSYIDFPVTINVKKQMFWGAAFFDQQLLNANKFKLNGRLALGGTTEGPLAYVRLYAKYRLFSWFSINAGVDGRMLKWVEPGFGEGASEYKGSLSIIYGFEINL